MKNTGTVCVEKVEKLLLVVWSPFSSNNIPMKKELTITL